MKLKHPAALFAAILGLCLAASPGSVHAQSTYVLDPVDPLTGFTTLAEWNTDDDTQGWTVSQMDPPAVSGGFLSGTSNGLDSTLRLNPLPAAVPVGKPGRAIVEMRVRRPATDITDFILFWADTAGGFAAGRSVVIPGANIPADGAFHTYRFTLLNTVGTNLTGIRIDATAATGQALDFDYVHLKVASGAPVLDPATTINLFTSLGEWNSSDLEGWTGNQFGTPSSLVAAQGYLSGTTSGNDPQVIKGGLTVDSTTGEFPILEIRMRKPAGEVSRVDLFWADGAGGFAAARVVSTSAWPNDGQFHVFQTALGPFLTGTLTSLRFDPVSDQTLAFPIDIDYIRIGRIDVDTDMDGLADSVEDNTGTYVDALHTGTDPAKFDTDNDGFSDGVEVAFGTDPTKAASFPNPALTGYAVTPAVYVRDVAITANNPVVANGSPTSYSVTPALPAGLSLNPVTGTLSGTPTAVAPLAPYAVTATFNGGITSTFNVTLTVRDPGIIRYGTNVATYRVGTAITGNNPILTEGPLPVGFSIAPQLPDGLSIDSITGSITGQATGITPATDYTVTATYSAYPASTAVLTLRVRAVPVFVGVDGAPIGNFTSFAEWDTDGDAQGWTFANAAGAVAGGNLTFTTSTEDPQMTRNGLGYDSAGGTLLEIRMRQNNTNFVEIFWGDAGGGPAPERSTTIPSSRIIPDNEFHTYQISFADVFNGNLGTLRLDPGTAGGHTAVFDYIRIGVAAPPIPLKITDLTYDPVFKELTLTWNSNETDRYDIEARTDLTSAWVAIVADTPGDIGVNTTSLFITVDPSAEPRRFFRVVKRDPLVP